MLADSTDLRSRRVGDVYLDHHGDLESVPLHDGGAAVVGGRSRPISMGSHGGDRVDTTGGKGMQFAYNSRMWIAFIPCAALILFLSGRLTTVITIIGLMLAYSFDLMGSRRWTLTVFWCTLCGVVVCFVLTSFRMLQSSLWNIPIILVVNAFVFLTGVWQSLQFRWIYQYEPRLARQMERTLFIAFPLCAFALLTWASFGFASPAAIPYISSLIFYGLMFLFGSPVSSSFRNDARGDDIFMELEYMVDDPKKTSVAQTTGDARLLQFAFLNLPPLFYASIFYPALFTGKNIREYWMNIGVLYCMQLFLLATLTGRKIFWWTRLSTEKLNRVRNVLLGLSCLVVLGYFEYRVVFNTFSSYIHVSAPWSYVYITVGLYGAFFVGLAQAVGPSVLGGQAGVLIVAALSATGISLAIDVPLGLLIFAPISAVYFCAFLNDHRAKYYFISIFAFVVVFAWFVSAHYWFLHHEWVFPLLRGMASISLRDSTLLIIVFIVLSLSVPLTAVVFQNQNLAGLLLALDVVVLGFLEQIFVFQLVPIGAPSVYSPIYVVITSALLIVLVQRCRVEHRLLTPVHQWIAVSLALAKLCILFSPPLGVLASAFYILVTLRPLFSDRSSVSFAHDADHHHTHHGSSPFAAGGVPFTTSAGGPLTSNAFLHVVASAFAAFISRHALIGRLYTLSTGQRPSYVLSVVFFLMLWSFSVLMQSIGSSGRRRQTRTTDSGIEVIADGSERASLSASSASSSSSSSTSTTALRQFAVLVFLCALLLACLRPSDSLAHIAPVNTSTFRWHTDALLYLVQLSPWSLPLTAALTLLLLVGALPGPTSFLPALIYAVLLGTGPGLYVAAHHVIGVSGSIIVVAGMSGSISLLWGFAALGVVSALTLLSIYWPGLWISGAPKITFGGAGGHGNPQLPFGGRSSSFSTSSSSTRAYSWPAVVYGLFLSLFPLVYTLLVMARLEAAPGFLNSVGFSASTADLNSGPNMNAAASVLRRERSQRAVQILVSVYAIVNILVSVLCKFRLMTLKRFQSAQLDSHGHGGIGQYGYYASATSDASTSSEVAMWESIVSSGGGGSVQRWLSIVGNLSVIVGLLCLETSSRWTMRSGSGPYTVFILAPLLLLLSADPIFFRNLTERNRYAPVVFAIVAVLMWHCFRAIILVPALDGLGLLHWIGAGDTLGGGSHHGATAALALSHATIAHGILFILLAFPAVELVRFAWSGFAAVASAGSGDANNGGGYMTGSGTASRSETTVRWWWTAVGVLSVVFAHLTALQYLGALVVFGTVSEWVLQTQLGRTLSSIL